MSKLDEEEEMGKLTLLICLILFAIPMLIVILIGIITLTKEDKNE